MSNDKLASTIDDAFEARDKIGPKTKGAVRKAVNAALELLDSGRARVAERKADGHWQVNQWLKKAVLLSFRLNDMSVILGGPAKPRGGTRSIPNSRAGVPRASARRASAPFPAVWFAARPSSRPASC
jgi:tetrahydrodipicolinate N-succinyltransferase